MTFISKGFNAGVFVVLWQKYDGGFFCQEQVEQVFPLTTHSLFPYCRCFFHTFMGPCIVNVFLSTTNKMQRIQYSLLLSVLYMFREVFPLIIRSSKTVHAASDTCQNSLLLPLTWVSWNDSSCCLWLRISSTHLHSHLCFAPKLSLIRITSKYITCCHSRNCWKQIIFRTAYCVYVPKFYIRFRFYIPSPSASLVTIIKPQKNENIRTAINYFLHILKKFNLKNYVLFSKQHFI